MTMEIIPAILPKDFADLEDHVALVKGLVPLVQVDICDGQFTPSPSWPYRKKDSNFDAIAKEARGLPFWEEVEYEFDLMVNNVQDAILDYVAAGASRIVLHAESKGDVAKAIDVLQGKVEIGLALNIDTPLDAVEPFKEKIQYIQLMGIDNVGFQGQSFDEKVIAKIRLVKEKYPDLAIQIDGSVNEKTAPLLRDAGAGRLIIGSAIFESDNIIETIERFKKV
jgi:ribulose-phosphate 3-epimerase